MLLKSFIVITQFSVLRECNIRKNLFLEICEGRSSLPIRVYVNFTLLRFKKRAGLTASQNIDDNSILHYTVLVSVARGELRMLINCGVLCQQLVP